MGQPKVTTPSRKGKHLTWDERLQIEVLLKKDHPIKEIAHFLERHPRTIEREVQKGEVNHLQSDLSVSKVYSSERGQAAHDLSATAKGPQLKLGAHRETAAYIRDQIVEEKKSPEVVAYEMNKANMPGAVCAKTLYTYIDIGLIEGVTNETLWEKRHRKKQRKKVLHRKPKSRPTRRKRIDERPIEAEDRADFGHWEIDLVVGGKGAQKPVLLTLLERKTRVMIIRKLSDRTQASVLKALNGIERSMGAEAFRVRFRSITADNGSEFLDVEALEASVFSKRKRTQIYYAHPYSSWERGSNENGNKMIRRFIPKGSCLSGYSRTEIRKTEEWINQYPRKILGFKTAAEMFNLEMAA